MKAAPSQRWGQARSPTVLRCETALLAASLLLLVSGQASLGQDPARDDRWADDIAAFVAADEENPPPKHGVLFVGSSSIRLWDLPKYFPDLPVINRGFGGSEVSDSLRYVDQLILKHQPSVVVLYAGDNDIDGGKSPEIVVDDYQKLRSRIHSSLPYTRLVFIAIKPSIARWELVDKMREANSRIREISQSDLRLDFVDIDSPMIGEDSRPRGELFIEDGLHLDEKGYELWSNLVRPFLNPKQREQVVERFVTGKIDREGWQLPYRLLEPASIEPETTYPLVVFLHGAGERGDDNQTQLVHGMPEFACDEVRGKYPSFVVAPQCPSEQKWVDAPWDTDQHAMPAEPSEQMSAVFALIDKLKSELPIDANRIYITGLSMGGFGVWDAAQRRPELFAAAAPVCGGGDVACADRLKSLPIWAAHGERDDAVDVKLSRDMIEAITKAGGKPKYSEYAGVGHHSWVNFYNDPDFYEWLFAQKK